MGTGAKPLVSTPCSCHYEGSLIDGTVFDSSYKRGSPSTFAPNQVIKARRHAAARVAGASGCPAARPSDRQLWRALTARTSGL